MKRQALILIMYSLLIGCSSGDTRVKCITYQISWGLDNMHRKTANDIVKGAMIKLDTVLIEPTRLYELIKKNEISAPKSMDIRYVAIFNQKDTLVLSVEGYGKYQQQYFRLDTCIGRILRVRSQKYNATYIDPKTRLLPKDTVDYSEWE